MQGNLLFSTLILGSVFRHYVVFYVDDIISDSVTHIHLYTALISFVCVVVIQHSFHLHQLHTAEVSTHLCSKTEDDLKETLLDYRRVTNICSIPDD